MVGTNGDADTSSNARNAGSRFLREEGVQINRGLLAGGCSWRGGGERFSVDSDRVGLRGTAELPRRGAAVAFCKVAFSSHRAALVAKNEANCCWGDSY